MTTNKRTDITPKSLQGRKPSIRVFREGGRAVVLFWKKGARHYKTYWDTPAGRQEAIAFAKGLSDEQHAPPRPDAPLTVGDLFRRYLEAESATLRPRTRTLYAQRWRRWELFVGEDTIAEDVSTEVVAKFRAEDAQHHAVNQVRSVIRVVKLVYAWADRLELISRNRVARYVFKQGKDERVHAPAEYRRGEWEQLLAALGGGQDSRKWRAWAVIMLAGSQGERVRAILQLRWRDVRLTEGMICWPAATNKQGRERVQPLTWEGLSALHAALRHAKTTDPDAFVVPGPRGDQYTYQAFWYQLRQAEDAIGLAHLPYRAAHGFRRMAAGNVTEVTGDPWLGLQWIGDTDPRRAREYLKERADRMQMAADAASGDGPK